MTMNDDDGNSSLSQNSSHAELGAQGPKSGGATATTPVALSKNHHCIERTAYRVDDRAATIYRQNSCYFQYCCCCCCCFFFFFFFFFFCFFFLCYYIYIPMAFPIPRRRKREINEEIKRWNDR